MNQLSFRDPDGFLVRFEEKLYRVILNEWGNETELLNETFFSENSIPNHLTIKSDVYDRIVSELDEKGFHPENVLTILEVEELQLITYPWEWTPTMLIDAGIFTLELQKKLMLSGLSLKDATFFNIQFKGNHTYFLDLLSIKRIASFYPWIPYGQFLRHFIYPSTLLKYHKIKDLKLIWSFIDGIDFDFANKLIPKKSVFNVFELVHYKVASRLLKKRGSQTEINQDSGSGTMDKLNNLLDWNISYLKEIKSKLFKKNSYWAEYYNRDVSSEYFQLKSKIIEQLISNVELDGRVLDIGSNTGEYSKLFLNHFTDLICVEKDTVCCEVMRIMLNKYYPDSTKHSWQVINSDIVNPDPGLGWMNKERKPLLERIKSTLVSVLGLTHHIYFTDSINFNQQVDLFFELTNKYLLIEYISAEDEKVKIISLTNLTRLTDYSRDNFVSFFCKRFSLVRNLEINSTRELFLFKK